MICKDCIFYDILCKDTLQDNELELCDSFKDKADFVEAKHGEWNLEIKSFYANNWDESIELIIYILATCPYCGEAHDPKQVFSKSLYPPEDATEDFRFNQAYEKGKVLAEFRQKNYKFQNYCPNCGAKMDGRRDT